MDYKGHPFNLNWPYGRSLTEVSRPSGTLPVSPQAWQATSFNHQTTSQVTFADIKAIADKFQEMNRRHDRTLFRFNGTIDHLKAALSAQGIEIKDDLYGTKELVESSVRCFPGMPIWASSFGLEVHELFNAVWIGTGNAIKALRDGVIFTVMETSGSMDTLQHEDAEGR